jgi:2-polyprenyl-3-methyl-5-hydroxy-6-metoxy-1,4-benzoquinol methylase
MKEQAPQTDIFYQIRNGTRAAAAMLAGMKLDLFTPLKDGPLNTERLASKIGAYPEKLGPLLYALVDADLLIEKQGEFYNTPETGEFLVRGKDRYLGDAHKIWYSNLFASLKSAETIRTGVPQAKYDWANMPKGELKALMEGMGIQDIAFANWLSAKYDFSQYRTLLDAGCGSGTLAITMTKIHSNLTATVIDLPQVTPITKQTVIDADASDRVTVVSADLTCDSIQGTYDVAILSSIIQTLSAEEARQVINNVGKVVNPGGWLYIFGSGMLENSRLSPKAAVNMNLVFINTYNSGQSYTEDEHQAWLKEAGFENFTFNYDELTIRAQKRTG